MSTFSRILNDILFKKSQQGELSIDMVHNPHPVDHIPNRYVHTIDHLPVHILCAESQVPFQQFPHHIRVRILFSVFRFCHFRRR